MFFVKSDDRVECNEQRVSLLRLFRNSGNRLRRFPLNSRAIKSKIKIPNKKKS